MKVIITAAGPETPVLSCCLRGVSYSKPRFWPQDCRNGLRQQMDVFQQHQSDPVWVWVVGGTEVQSSTLLRNILVKFSSHQSCACAHALLSLTQTPRENKAVDLSLVSQHAFLQTALICQSMLPMYVWETASNRREGSSSLWWTCC